MVFTTKLIFFLGVQRLYALPRIAIHKGIALRLYQKI